MVFVKNPELGKVKTRLAKTMGDERALEVYKELLQHTSNVANKVTSDKAVFYSSFIDKADMWANEAYDKYLQEGNDLGEKMLNAFGLAFQQGYEKIIIIGSDCYELAPEIVEQAFVRLEEKDVVIGPAKDGGYYLLGMKSLYMKLFSNKPWSTENVLVDTLLDVKEMGLNYELLETLSDVDHETDLEEFRATRAAAPGIRSGQSEND